MTTTTGNYLDLCPICEDACQCPPLQSQTLLEDLLAYQVFTTDSEEDEALLAELLLTTESESEEETTALRLSDCFFKRRPSAAEPSLKVMQGLFFAADDLILEEDKTSGFPVKAPHLLAALSRVKEEDHPPYLHCNDHLQMDDVLVR